MAGDSERPVQRRRKPPVKRATTRPVIDGEYEDGNPGDGERLATAARRTRPVIDPDGPEGGEPSGNGGAPRRRPAVSTRHDDEYDDGEVADRRPARLAAATRSDDADGAQGLRSVEEAETAFVSLAYGDGMDREIEVRFPDETQVAMWQRFGDRYSGTKAGTRVAYQTAVDMSSEAIDVVTSVMVHEADRRWVERMLLRRELVLADVMPLIDEALEALREANGIVLTREERRGSRRRATLA